MSIPLFFLGTEKRANQVRVRRLSPCEKQFSRMPAKFARFTIAKEKK